MPFRLHIEMQDGQLVFDKKQVKAALRSAGTEIAAFTRSLLNNSRGTGKRGASLPGQPPARLSGNLARSIKVKMFRRGIGVVVKATTRYAAALEKGAKGGGGSTKPDNIRKAGTRAYGRYGKILGANRMITTNKTRRLLARPYLSVVLEERASSIEARLKDAVLKGIKFQRAKAPRAMRR